MNRKVSGMPGWTDIGSDLCWEDHGGQWAKRAADGSWYVVRFTNMHDACGEEECKRDGQDQYVAEVSRVDLADLDADVLPKALACVGLRFEDEAQNIILNDQGDEIAKAGEPPKPLRGKAWKRDQVSYELVLVEACVSYGAHQPLDSFSGNVRPANVRAEARRCAESYMKDAARLNAALDRPVNKIGSTAREYARGEIMPALERLPEGDVTKGIMSKMIGMPTLGGGVFGEK